MHWSQATFLVFTHCIHQCRFTRPCACLYVCVWRSCARVYLPISRKRNGTFLVKVFIRFLVKVSNFSAASDTYVYLCIIYHNVSRAVYVYFCYRKVSVAKKKERAVRLLFFLANSCAFCGSNKTSSPLRKWNNYNHRYVKLSTCKILLYSCRVIMHFT